MQTEVVLTFMDEDGRRREVRADSRRFTIGSSADNDLVLDAPGVSRRHAIIESFDDGVFIYDCQTQHGTLINNSPLEKAAALQSGDLLTFGGTHDFTVRLSAPDNSTNSSRAHGPSETRQTLTRTSRAASPRVSSPRAAPRPVPLNSTARRAGEHEGHRRVGLIVGATTLILIILGGGLLLLANKKSSSLKTGSVTEQALPDVAPSGSPESIASEGDGGGAAPSSSDSAAIDNEELERLAARVVQRVSGDEKAYVFPPEAIRDVRQHVEEYRQSARLRDALAAMQPAVRSVATQARGAGIEPELVIYAALERSSEGGQNPVALAQQMLPQLRELRATFGSSDADSSLIVLAAYTDGVGSKKSHPLLTTIRRLVGNSFTERNVWHLREHGGLSDAAYRAVVRTIAVGIIAQDPRHYGIQTGPLVY